MSFIDYAKIYIKSGKGGDGHVSFRRELYVPNGGPNGGDGGRGGDVILVVDESLNTLVPFKHKYKYIAEDGEEGGKNRSHGKDGKDLIIKVPNGTIVRETNSNKIIIDMTSTNKEFVILKGGRGGLGNMHFATSKMQAPRYAKPGEAAKELYITLELKVLADVGLVGFPNVGKSSLITKLTNARPEVNNYHFTTINPHLGVVNVYDKNFVIADIPGIIEGAGDGVGLGLRFLKHIERTKVLLHVVDIAGTEGRDPVNDLRIIFNELDKYSLDLKNKKQIIAANKIDSIDEESLNKKILEIKNEFKDIPIYKVSALTNVGLKELVLKLAECVNEVKNDTQTFESEVDLDTLLHVDIEEVIINKTNNDTYEITGEKIKKMLGYTNLDTEKGLNFLQQFLKKEGIIQKLKNMGMIDGNTINIYGYEFEYYD